MTDQPYQYRSQHTALPAGPDAIEHLMESIDRSVLPQIGNIQAIRNLALWAFENAPVQERLQIMAGGVPEVAPEPAPKPEPKREPDPPREWQIKPVLLRDGTEPGGEDEYYLRERFPQLGPVSDLVDMVDLELLPGYVLRWAVYGSVDGRFTHVVDTIDWEAACAEVEQQSGSPIGELEPDWDVRISNRVPTVHTPMQGWRIYLGSEHRDTVFYAASMSKTDVRDTLVDVEGWSPLIHLVPDNDRGESNS